MLAPVLLIKEQLDDLLAPVKTPFHVAGNVQTEPQGLFRIFEELLHLVIVFKRQCVFKQLWK